MIDASFIEKIASMVKRPSIEVDGITLYDKNYSHFKPAVPMPLLFPSLDGLVAWASWSPDRISDEPVAVLIKSHDQVEILGALDHQYKQRNVYAIATNDGPEFEWGRYYDQESFIIALQTMFEQTDHLTELIRIAGTVLMDQLETSVDDGVSQTATARAGVTVKERVKLPSPIVLAPYRTFRELSQPASPFIFRVKKGNGGPAFALFEADGGTWKLEARRRINQFLESALVELKVPILE